MCGHKNTSAAGLRRALSPQALDLAVATFRPFFHVYNPSLPIRVYTIIFENSTLDRLALVLNLLRCTFPKTSQFKKVQ